MIYKRNPDVVKAQLVQTTGGQVVCKSNCRIQIPTRFVSMHLAQVGTDNFAYGAFPIILDSGEYAVINICAFIKLNPTSITEVKVQGEDYYEFRFDANTVVISTTEIMKRDTILFTVFDEFFFKGKIPWYISYFDLCKIFETARDYAGSNVSDVEEVIEFIAAMVTRLAADPKQYIRVAAKSPKDFTADNLFYVALKSVIFSVNSTLNKLAGNYFDEGIRSALVTETKSVDKIESILRA